MKAQNQYSIMTYNIRYDNPGDGVNQWKFRKHKINTLFSKYHPDVIGVQEALFNQMQDMLAMKALKGYAYVGVGRDDGKTHGEYAAIFYRTSLFDVDTSGTFWLSPTPDSAGSKGWDAAITRICTFARLRSKSSGKYIFVFNVHFDHIGNMAREESAKLVLNKVKALAGNDAVCCIGDFNSEPTDAAYHTMLSDTDHRLFDSQQIEMIKHLAMRCTYQEFSVLSTVCKRIDYIFYNQHILPKSYAILADHDGKNYPSDHKPVLLHFALP